MLKIQLTEKEWKSLICLEDVFHPRAAGWNVKVAIGTPLFGIHAWLSSERQLTLQKVDLN